MTRGKYIVLEGPEGVGKTTQLLELARRLQAAGLPVRTLREPDSQSDLTARAIRQLTQDPRYPMNTRTEVLLYNAARAQSLEVIKQSIEHGVICLVDRNYLTTLAIQYYGRGDVPDYETINNIIKFAVGGMEPDLCILLDAPVATLRQRLGNRYNGERFDNLDDAFLERVRAGYLWEAHQRQLPIVYATDDTQTVADTIWKLVSIELSARSGSQPATTSAPTSVKEIIEQKQMPVQPVEPEVKTDPAAAPAVTDEESVQLPADIIQLSVEGISYLLAPKFMSPKVAGTFGEALRAVDLREDETAPKNHYYTPPSLKPVVKKQYQQGMDMLFAAYKVMLERLTEQLFANSQATDKERGSEAWQVATSSLASDTLRGVLPLSSTSAVSLTISRENLQNLIIELMGEELPEARTLGESLQQHGHENVPMMLEDGNTPDGNGSVATYRRQTAATLKALARQRLADNYATATDTISLVDFWPKNELLLVPDMLYEFSNLALEQLQAEISGWPYEDKTAIFKAYIGRRRSLRHRPGQALEKSHYSWDLVSDYGSFLDIQQYLMGDDLSWQESTPRYGYAIPKLVEEAGLTEQYEACFETSLKLHSYLQQSGHPLEAQYVTLMGHKLRWKTTFNAREAFRVLETPYIQPATLDLAAKMHEKIAEVHPLTADSISFATPDK